MSPLDDCVHGAGKESVCELRVLTEAARWRACACPCRRALGLYLARWPIKPAKVNPSHATKTWEEALVAAAASSGEILKKKIKTPSRCLKS